MDLERRVEALEKELQILKAQIQATLLDIQEQILTNAYPSLRAENAAPPPERPAAMPANPITILAANPAPNTISSLLPGATRTRSWRRAGSSSC